MPRRKWNINDKLRRSFSGAGWCECGLDGNGRWCCPGWVPDCEANHVPCRGMAGGSRLDTRLTLIRMAPFCHGLYHAGEIRRADLEIQIAEREGCKVNDLREAVRFLQSLPWCPLAARCAADRGLGGLSEAVSVLVVRTLQEAKV